MRMRMRIIRMMRRSRRITMTMTMMMTTTTAAARMMTMTRGVFGKGDSWAQLDGFTNNPPHQDLEPRQARLPLLTCAAGAYFQQTIPPRQTVPTSGKLPRGMWQS